MPEQSITRTRFRISKYRSLAHVRRIARKQQTRIMQLPAPFSQIYASVADVPWHFPERIEAAQQRNAAIRQK